MSQQERNGYGGAGITRPRYSSPHESSGKTWKNPLDEAGPSTSRPSSGHVETSPSNSKRNSSPNRSERSSKRQALDKEENGRQNGRNMEGHSESAKRRSRSPEPRYGDRYQSRSWEDMPSQRNNFQRHSTGNAYVPKGQYSGGRDRREGRNDTYDERSSGSHRSRHDPRRDEKPGLPYGGSGRDSWRAEEPRSPVQYGREFDRDRRDRDSERQREHRRESQSHSSRSRREEGSRSHRHRSRSRSPPPDERRPEPETEEGEIADVPWPDTNREDLPHSSDRLSFAAPMSTPGQPSEAASELGSASGHRPIKIKNRPTKQGSDNNLAATARALSTGSGAGGDTTYSRHSDNGLPSVPPPPPPPPADDRPMTPSPPGLSAPPPPADKPPTPPAESSLVTPEYTNTSKSNPLSPSHSASSSQPPKGPVNRTLDIAKSQAKYDEHGDRTDGKASVPHAPNRNLLNPNTRPTTPAAKFDTPGPRDLPASKLFLRPNAEEELEILHKSFAGTTTLAAYDLGDKLGEGTFG